MSDGHIERGHTPQEHRVRFAHDEPHPAVGVPAVRIPGERRVDRPRGFQRRCPPWQQARSHQHLKPVADPQHELSRVDKLDQRVAQAGLQLQAKNHAGAYVVPVAEATGNAEDLGGFEQIGRFEHAKQVDPIRRRTTLLERKCGLGITIGAWGAKDENVRIGHADVSGTECVARELIARDVSRQTGPEYATDHELNSEFNEPRNFRYVAATLPPCRPEFVRYQCNASPAGFPIAQSNNRPHASVCSGRREPSPAQRLPSCVG